MRTTPLVFKLWIFSYSVVGLRLTWPPLVAAPSPLERRALSSCQFTGSANRPQADWMTLPYRPAPDALRPRSETRNGERRFGGCRKTQFGKGLVRQAAQSAGAGRTTPRVWRWKWKRRLGLMKDAVRPGWYPWETAGRGEWRGTQSGPWLLSEPPPDGNCVATVSVRPAVVADGPERVKPAVPQPVSGNCAAAVWGSGRSLLSARPQGEDREASQPLRRRVSPRVKVAGNAVLFL